MVRMVGPLYQHRGDGRRDEQEDDLDARVGELMVVGWPWLDALAIALQELDAPSNAPPAVAPGRTVATRRLERLPPSRRLIVDDAAPDDELRPGQLRRGDFVAVLHAAITEAADAELAPERSTEGCPYLAHIVAYYQQRDAEHLERALRHYAGGGTRGLDAAAGLVPFVVERVRHGVRAWRDSGRLPAEALAMAPRPAGLAITPADVTRQLGDGAPAPAAVVEAAADTYGESLSDVRVHTDARAAALAGEHGAVAVTVGNQIAFAPGAYQPDTVAGDALLAHELAHVVQQRGAPAAAQHRPLATDPVPAHEDDADEAATSVLARLYGGVKGVAGALTGRARPAISSGMRLSRCVDPPPTVTEQQAADLARRHRVGIDMSPALAPGQPAVVGMNLRFTLRRPVQTGSQVTFAGEWQLTYPSGRIDWSPSVEMVRLPITEPGTYRMRSSVIVQSGALGGDRQVFPIEQTFTAVDAGAHARSLLPGVADNSYEEMRSPLEIQRALLRPPGPSQQASGDYRIDTTSPNPASVTDRGPDISFSVARTATSPAPPTSTYHWYVKALNPQTLPYHRDRSPGFGNLRTVSLDGQGGYFDLGTGVTAQMPSTEHNVFVVVCRVLDASGQRLSEARYLQTVLNDAERRDLEKLEAYMARAEGLAGRLRPESRTPLTAVHVAVEAATTNRLQLFAGPSAHGITIVDLTPGLDPEHHQLEFHGATFDLALAEFRARNHHLRGVIRLRVPANNHLGPNGAAIPTAEHEIVTTGETQLDSWPSRFGLASLVLLGAAVVAAPFTGGGSVAVALLLIGSAAAGVAAGALSLAERLQHAELSPTGVALDIVGIVTSFVAGGAAIRGLAAGAQAVNVMGQASRFVLWTNFVGSGVAAVLVSVESIQAISSIVGDPTLTADQKRMLLIRVVTTMALTGRRCAATGRLELRARGAGAVGCRRRAEDHRRCAAAVRARRRAGVGGLAQRELHGWSPADRPRRDAAALHAAAQRRRHRLRGRLPVHRRTASALEAQHDLPQAMSIP